MKHVVECGCAYDDQKDGIFWCDLHREAGIVRAQRTTLFSKLEILQKAVESFVYNANFTPPWESAGAVWGEMCKRLNNALIDSREPVEPSKKERVCPQCGGDHLEALTCQERIGVYER